MYNITIDIFQLHRNKTIPKYYDTHGFIPDIDRFPRDFHRDAHELIPDCPRLAEKSPWFGSGTRAA
jgi:hypothetical protein